MRTYMKTTLRVAGILFFILPNIWVGAGSSNAVLNAQIINIEKKRINQIDTIGWFGNVDLGFSIFQNGSTIFTFNGGSLIEYVRNKHLFLAINQFNLLKAERENFLNDGFQHLRYNYAIHPWLTYEAFGQAQYNEKVRIRFRGLLGTGMRFKPFRDKNFFLGASYMYEYEEESKTEVIHRGHRMSTYVFFSI